MVITASEAENYPMEYLRAMLTGKWIVSPLFLKTKSEIDTLLNVSFVVLSKIYHFIEICF